VTLFRTFISSNISSANWSFHRVSLLELKVILWILWIIFQWRNCLWGFSELSWRCLSFFLASSLYHSHALCIAPYVVLLKNNGNLCLKYCFPHLSATHKKKLFKALRSSDFPSWHICKCEKCFCPKVSFQKQYTSESFWFCVLTDEMSIAAGCLMKWMSWIKSHEMDFLLRIF